MTDHPALPDEFLGQQAAEVWARARLRHLQRVEVLERAVLALMDGDLNDELREMAESEAHALAGTVGTFGMRAGSRLARALEQSFSARHTLDPGLAAKLADQVLLLRRELERPAVAAALTAQAAARRRVLLVTDGARGDYFVAEGIGLGLEVIVRSVSSGVESVAEEVPEAIVVDVPDDSVERLAFLLDAVGRRATGPIVVLTPNDTLSVRLAIARAGAMGPIPPGATPGLVLQRVVALLANRARTTAGILIVDSDPLAIRHATMILEQAGHRVHGLSGARHLWETLDVVGPDLVVFGATVGDVMGVDLCRALRADPRWRELPVVFVAGSGESDLVRDAYRAGGDDVLRKPLRRAELIARVENRLQRSRVLRRQGESNALTRLPGRQRAERDLDRFLRLARRHAHPVTLAVLRLDRYAALVSRVGQASLDAASLAFSQVLGQTFRAEDLVSQWGPNEFVVGLFDATATNATARVREVMAAIRERTFTAPSGDVLTLTCSAGLATFPDDGTEVRELHAAADAAFLLAAGSGEEEVLGVASAPNTAPAGRVDVLIVDEDPSVATLLVHALESRQYSVQWFGDGRDAADALLQSPARVRARVILLEVNLAGLNGLSLLRSLGEHDVLRHSRVIVLSTRTTETETLQAFELGAVDYVSKPFSVAVLTERIKRALRS
jgi:diguanylate cyclase (GGDEF)-like protein